MRATLGLPQAVEESHGIVVRDLSAGGANIADAVPGVGINDPMVLVLDGRAATLNGHLAQNDRNGVLIKFNLTAAAEMLVSNLRTARRMIKQPDIWAPNGCQEGIAVWYRGSEAGCGLWRWPFGPNSGKWARAIPLFRETDSGMPAP